MNSSKFRLTLDLHSVQSQYSIPVMVGDTYITLLISISDGGVPYTIADGCLAKLSIKRPSGSYLEEFCKITNNSIIEYPFKQNENTCAEAGIHFCDVTLYSPDGEELGTPSFIMVVSEKVVRRDDIDLSTDDYTAVNAMMAQEATRQAEETKRAEAEVARSDAEAERIKAEEARVEAENERAEAMKEIEEGVLYIPDRSIARVKIAYAAIFEEHISNSLRLDLYRSRWAFEAATAHDKRLTNLERGYEDELVVSAGSPAAPYWTVPENALPYAEIKKIYGRGYKESDGTFVTHKIVRVESCKYAEKEALDATLDLSEMVDTMTVEKLSDGSFKFSGYTNGAACKFATVTLPAGYYGINYKVVSGDYNDSVHITAKNTDVKEDVFYHWGWFSINEGESLNLSIDYNQASGALADYVLAFEIQKGQWDGHEDGSFVPGLEPIATLDIPQEIYDKEWYGMHAYNFVDLENGKLVITRKIVDGTIITLSEPEEIDVRGILRPDNLLAVVPGGIIRVIQNTRDGNSKCEIEFMLKGV